MIAATDRPQTIPAQLNPLVDTEVLSDLGEFLAAGYFEQPEASPMGRWSRAVRRRFERRRLIPYKGELLYPCGPASAPEQNRILSPSFSFTYSYNEDELTSRLETATPVARRTLSAMTHHIRDLNARLRVIVTPHTVGGRGYTHSIPNYGRVLREGLSEYGRRARQGLAAAEQREDRERADFYLGLLDVLSGVRTWHQRLLVHLRNTPTTNEIGETRRRHLITAYERVPFLPARDFFEALVAYNFVYYVDDCDNLGRVDMELSPYFERDLDAGLVTHEEARLLIGSLWDNCDANYGWSAGIGGTTPTGGPNYSDLTTLCLEAARGKRRPNLQLHVRQDMPAGVWDAALDTIASGCGLPALYNEEEYLRSLRLADLGVREEDIGWHNGGGCTETMIHGRSNVGSLDAGINLPSILVDTLDAHLATVASFDQLMDSFKQDVARVARDITAQVSADQKAKSRLRPQPVRSLLIDDCIESGKEFNAGGARYNWSVINVAGLANVVDSLAAVREVVFEKTETTGHQLLCALRNNFRGEEPLRRRLGRCSRFGNDDLRADGIASDVAEFVFRQFLQQVPWRGGKYLPSCLMFVTYARAGAPVGATPDGRLAGEPLADSAGPYQGRDVTGPTAMLKSVTAMPHYLAPGTLVVNLRFARDLFESAAGREKVRDLVRTYFRLGGMQLQINVVDQDVLRAAMERPERFGNLIIRVGGYSEYFNRLSDALKQSILERTEYR